MEISGDMSMVGINYQKMLQTMFQSRDEDSDGSLSIEEMSIPKEAFAKIDKDQNGLADPEELKAFFQMAEFDRIAADIIAKQDVNGDGVLSPDEVKMPDELFGKMDQNADGKLDKNEIADFASRASQQGNKTGKKGGGKSKGGTTESVVQIDTDGDGIADAEEVTTLKANGEVESVTTRQISDPGSGPVGLGE